MNRTIRTAATRTSRPGRRTVLIGAIATALSAAAVATPQLARANSPDITEFATPDATGFVSGAPDGTVWVTHVHQPSVSKLTTQGKVLATYDLPGLADGIITADGKMWMSMAGDPSIVRMNPDGTGLVLFHLPGDAMTLTASADGKTIWFTSNLGNAIGNISSDGKTVHSFPVPTANSGPRGLTRDAAGNFWFTESNTDKIGMITPAGTITEREIPGSQPSQIVAASDGSEWFTGGPHATVGRITPTGALETYRVPLRMDGAWGIQEGSDGTIYVAGTLNAKGKGRWIGSVRAGEQMQLRAASIGSMPLHLAPGPDGNIWISLQNKAAVARLTVH